MSDCFSKIKKKEKKENNQTKKQTSKLTLKTQNNLADTCCQKPSPVNSVLEQLHSPTHISSEGLLQYSIGNYTSTASSKSSFTAPKVSKKIKIKTVSYHTTIVCSWHVAHDNVQILFIPMTWLPDIM